MPSVVKPFEKQEEEEEEERNRYNETDGWEEKEGHTGQIVIVCTSLVVCLVLVRMVVVCVFLL